MSGSSFSNMPLFNDFWRARWLIVGCVVVTAAAALVGSLFAPRKYQARVSVLVEPQKESNPLRLEVRSFQERQAFMETQKEVVVSRSVVTRTLARLRGCEPDQVAPEDADRFLRCVNVSSRSGLGRNFFGGEGISESNTFFVTVRSCSPKEAANAANALVSAYIEVNRELKARMAAEALQVLQASAEESTRQTSGVYTMMAELEREAGDLLPDLLDAGKPTLRVFPELEKLREAYAGESASIAQQKARVDLIRQALQSTGSAVLMAETFASDAAVAQIRGKLADLKMELVKQTPFFRESSREIQSLREQILMAEEVLCGEIRRMCEAEEARLKAMNTAQRERLRILGEYHDRVTSLSRINSRYTDVKRMYEGLAKAQQQQVESLASARIAAADHSQQDTNIAVLDRAVADSRPVSPNAANNGVVGGALGFGIGILLTLLRISPTPTSLYPSREER